MSQAFRKTAAVLFKARFPYIAVQSSEEQRVVEEIAAVARDEELIRTRRRVFVWSLTSGMAELHRDGSRDTSSPTSRTGRRSTTSGRSCCW